MSDHQHEHQHDHRHQQPDPDADRWSADFWDDRYSSGETRWSGRVNPVLAEEVAGLAPGRALEVGCGTGADAIHLAAHGWQVTAVDVSQVALDQGAEAAVRELGPEADRLTWQQRDLFTWTPPAGAHDLVTGAFLHLPPEHRTRVHAGMAGAVAPGGTLLLVLHDLLDLHHGIPRPPEPELFPQVDALLADLPDDGWEIVTAESRPRPGTLPDGHEVTLHDTVLRVRRPVG